MDGVTTIFLIMGGIGIALLILSLLAGDLLPIDNGGVFSLPVIAGFVSALGFGGAIGAQLTPGPGGVQAFTGVGVGLLFAVPAAWLTVRLTRSVSDMHTDGTPGQDDLLGAVGVVVTAIEAERFGEVRVTLAGQPVKLRARSSERLTTGTQVFVIAAESATTVIVESTAAILPNTEDTDKRDRPR